MRLPMFASLVALVLMTTQPALAYIEPGSGGMMVQLLLAGAVGLGMWIRIYWNRLLGLFGKRKQAVQSVVEANH